MYRIDYVWRLNLSSSIDYGMEMAENIDTFDSWLITLPILERKPIESGHKQKQTSSKKYLLYQKENQICSKLPMKYSSWGQLQWSFQILKLSNHIVVTHKKQKN